MADERWDLRQVDFSELFPWTLLFSGFRLARDPKKIALGAAGVLLMCLGWSFVASFSADRLQTPPEVPGPQATEQEKQDYQRQLDSHREQVERQRLLAEARRLPWNTGASLPPGVYTTPFQKSGWTTFGIEVPASFFMVVEPIRSLLLPAQLTFLTKGSTTIGLALLVWTLVVWSLFGAAICRISAVQVARNGQVGLTESIRFAMARYLSFFTSPILPFLGVVLIVLFCLVGALLINIPGLNVVGGLLWFLPLLAGFVMVAALLGLAVGWPLMYAAIGAEATESFDALSRAFSYVLGRPWSYFFYGVIAIVYGGLLSIFVVTVGYAVVHMSQYAVSWGYSDVSTLYAFVPEAPGWRDAFGPARQPDGSTIVAPSGSEYVTALFVAGWTHLLFLGVVGFIYSYFWSQVTVIYFLLRRDVDETELEEVYLEEEDEEPFPTATPTVAPPKAAEPPANKGSVGPSLPIIDPPH